MTKGQLREVLAHYPDDWEALVELEDGWGLPLQEFPHGGWLILNAEEDSLRGMGGGAVPLEGV